MVRFLFFSSILIVSTGAFAHDVTITGTQTFASLDGSSSDHDGAANGVFTVNDGNLVVSGVVNCNDDATTSACSMSFAVSGNVSIATGGALYAENRSGGGTGGAISITAGGNVSVANGGIVSTSSRSSSGATGGNIGVSAGGTINVASGGTIDSGSFNAQAGKISLTASGLVTVDGNVLAGPSRTLLAGRLGPGAALDGGTSNQIGGEITIASTSFVQPSVVIGTNASIVSQGETNGAGPVNVTGCGIEVRGLVAALSKKDAPARVSIRSGQSLLVDARDLGVAGATGGRTARVRADAPTGSAINKGVDLFGAEGVQVLGPAAAASTQYTVTSLPGVHDSKSYGGLIRIMSTTAGVTASGNVIDNGRSNSGDTGGTIEISAKGNVNLDTAVIRAIGDFNTNNPNRGGGSISVRSYSGNVVWTNGLGEVRPVGSNSGLTSADQGAISLTACGSVTTTNTSFPVLGTATSVFPNVQTGACSAAAPSLPAGVPPFVVCNNPPVANDATASTNEDQSVTVTLTGSDVDGDPLTFSVVSAPAHGTAGTVVSVNATSATVVYTPSSNYNGSDSFVVQANDGRGGTDTATVTITIAAVNDAPVFQAGTDVSSLEDTGAQTFNGWAASISGGPADEAGQSVTFSVTGNTNAALFSTAPQVSPTGVLTYTSAPNAFGSATITIVAQDNGGTANGGVNTSASQSFTITVNNVNDAPSFTGGADQSANEDAGAQSVANWATGISAGTGEGSQSVSFNVTANSNAALFAAGPAVSANGTLTYTPAANANGTATITVAAKDNGGTANGGSDTSASYTFTITVNAVNDAPSFTSGGNVTVLEDSAAYSAAWATAISAGPSDENGQSVSFSVTGNTNASLFAVAPSISPAGVLSFSLAANAYGSATITVNASDDGGTANGGANTSASQSFTITVTPVNDAPSFTAGANQTVNEDSGAHTVANWATSISAGPSESGQALTFTVASNSNPSLFSAGPAVSPNGTLSYTLAANANGSATITVSVSDDGGTANGGNNTSAAQSFTITVNAVNDAPSFTSGGNVSALEDSGAYSAAWATAISAGPADENGQAVSFNVTGNTNASLFSVAPSVSSAGVLSFTLAANAFGSATITVTATDDGGTANGGANTSASQSFTITVNGVNDAPSFTAGANQTVNEDSGPHTIANWAASISAGPGESGQALTFTVTGNSNPSLFSAGPAISSNGTLSYTLAANANGSATITVSLSDDGGTANGGSNTSAAQSFTITVNAVNDAPSFTSGGNVSALEDSGAYSAAWATAISAGPADENGQAVSFNVTGNTNASLFAVAPSISSAGVLSFTLAGDAFGSATITVTATDDGGTANGGANTSASQSFTITVNGVNDAPSFTAGANQTVNEDSGPHSVANWAASISAGPGESGQALTFTVTGNSNASLFAAGPAVSSDGTLSYTLAANANGSATITVSLSDDGGTANGGSNSSAAQSFTITVNAVNDAPSFTGGGNVAALEDAGAQTVTGWATGMSAGPADEAGQAFAFTITSNSNTALFAAGPALAADGTLSYTPAANAFGSATITVVLTDDGGGANASAPYTFTITVNPVNDAPSYTAGGDVTVDEDSGAYSAAWATAISVGPNESGQTVSFSVSNSNNALFSAQPAISPAGVLTFTPAANAFGSATVTVSMSDNGGTANGGVDAGATVTFTITVKKANEAPKANNDTWETIGNTELRVDLAAGTTAHVADTTASGKGVLDNDSDGDGDPVTITSIVGCSDTTAPFDCTFGNGAKLSMQANGSFTYVPGAGATSGSFQYVVADQPSSGAPASATGTVNVTVHDQVWYVRGGAAGGNGTSVAPYGNFASLSGAGDVDAPGAYIFVYNSNVTGGITLEANQRLWGEGVGLTINRNLNGNGGPVTLVPAGIRPTITNSSDVVTVNNITGTEIAGLNLSSGGGNAVNVTSNPLGSNAASANIYNSVVVAAGAEGIDVNGGGSAGTTVNVSNTSITSNGNGFNVSSVGGTVAVSFINGTITSTGGHGVSIDGSAGGNVVVTGLANVTVTGNTAGEGIRVVSATFDSTPGGAFDLVNGGNVTVGASGNGVGGNGVVFSNVTGAYAFAALNAWSDNGAAASISGTGAGFTVTSGGGSLVAANGTGLSVTDATIGTAGLKFVSISAKGGVNGIALRNTGNAGGLTVTGNGTAGSGGTIENTTGDGVSLRVTHSTSLSSMNVQSSAHNGIAGTGVVNFSFVNGSINGAGLAAAGADKEGGIAFNTSVASTENNVSGTVVISGSTIANVRRNAIDISNWSGTLASLTITNNTVTSSTSAAASLGHAISVAAQGSASGVANVTAANISNNRISNFPSGSGIFVIGGSAAAAAPFTMGVPNTANAITISGNSIAGASSAVRMGSNAIAVATAGCNGQANFVITNNGTAASPITNIAGIGISHFIGGSIKATTLIDGNVIVANNTAGSAGIATQVDQACGSTDAGNSVVTITNNRVSNTEGNGIRGLARASNGTMKMKVANNIVGAPTLANRNGIRIDSGSGTGNVTVCLEIADNTSTGSGVSKGIGLRKQGTNAGVNAFGIVGMAATSSPGIESYVNSQNPAGGGTELLSATTGFTSCVFP